MYFYICDIIFCNKSKRNRKIVINRKQIHRDKIFILHTDKLSYDEK
jgi:hypothetical protein